MLLRRRCRLGDSSDLNHLESGWFWSQILFRLGIKPLLAMRAAKVKVPAFVFSRGRGADGVYVHVADGVFDGDFSRVRFFWNHSFCRLLSGVPVEKFRDLVIGALGLFGVAGAESLC